MQKCDGFVGKSKFSVEELPGLVNKLGPLSDTVIVQGETGTGKSVVVAMLHAAGKRQGDAVIFNCAATPAELFESELFGHQKGAYTGAAQPARGAVMAASGGTLCLDEIGEVPMPCQQKFLRMLDGWFKPLGAQQELPVQSRVLATTNRDLEAMVKDKSFRLDLYHRLHAHVIAIPPLRERRVDIRPLLEHFVGVLSQNQGEEVGFEIRGDGLMELSNYPWPGNVRELRNAVSRALVHRQNTRAVSTSDILAQIVPRTPKAAVLYSIGERGTVPQPANDPTALSNTGADSAQDRVARLQRGNLELFRLIKNLEKRVEELESDSKFRESRRAEL